MKLLVNGRDIDFLNRLETKLKEGDEVALFPPVGGG
jgi:molybdopterin converting factor small subunit